MIGDAHVDRRKGHMKSPVTKRTVSINGRKNGVSVEDAFWSTLKEIAHVQGATVSQMVTEIEKSRQRGELVHGDPPVRTRPGPFIKIGGRRALGISVLIRRTKLASRWLDSCQILATTRYHQRLQF